MVRWSLVVSEEIDRDVRSYLGAIGAKKGGLSHLVEEAVRRYLVEESATTRQPNNGEYSEQEIMDLIDEAARETLAAQKNN
ncbi:MAG: hypothetical protein EA365_06120 [Gloeocapsa sp. DLM2.Bin57]|nr:MAG: hypothetical protein EA365_06120 [Gloeocapsa sp. DLM2.Bin57]